MGPGIDFRAARITDTLDTTTQRNESISPHGPKTIMVESAIRPPHYPPARPAIS
jgi:hypothetical protein